MIGDHQRFKGYSLFLCKEHATEIHYLEKEFRRKFLEEMNHERYLPTDEELDELKRMLNEELDKLLY